jgi:hypothetical protein
LEPARYKKKRKTREYMEKRGERIGVILVKAREN